MKVIFLDFDGVILTLRTCVAHGKHWSAPAPDPVLVQALTRCCETGVKIVVSSPWRECEPTCKAKLAECGLDRFLHEDWRTNDARSNDAYFDRPLQVSEWLMRHPEVSDYRILDDDPWNWTGDQKTRFLKCCPENGADARVMIEMLRWVGLTKHE